MIGMEEKEKKVQEDEKKKRIKLEIRRIKIMFRSLNGPAMKRAEFLINRIAFMKCTLEDLEISINEFGMVEKFTQDGIHYYDRERPASKMYSVMIRNYSTTLKQLFGMLPIELVTEEVKDELMKFISAQK